MGKELISRAEFARRAGVSGAAVTKAASTLLRRASEGKRINLNHPDAVKYLEEKGVKLAPPLAPGIDPIYPAVVEWAQENNIYTVRGIKGRFKVGNERAKRLVTALKDGGLIPPKTVTITIPYVAPVKTQTPTPTPTPTPAPVVKKVPHIRGHQAAKQKKKDEYIEPDDVIEVPDNIRAFAHMTLTELITKFGTDTRFVDWLNATQKIEGIHEKRLKNAQTQGELVSRSLISVGIIEPIDAAHRKLLTDGSRTISRRAVAMVNAGRTPQDIEKFVAEQITSFIRPVKAKVARVLKNA